MVISESMRDKATLYFWQLLILTDNTCANTHTKTVLYVNKILNI